MLEQRRFLYERQEIDNNLELDYIIGPIPEMDISFKTRFTITSQFEGRPDLISLKFFNSFNFGWLICDYNDILDPFDDLVTGVEIKIPSAQEYYSFFNNKSIT